MPNQTPVEQLDDFKRLYALCHEFKSQSKLRFCEPVNTLSFFYNRPGNDIYTASKVKHRLIICEYKLKMSYFKSSDN